MRMIFGALAALASIYSLLILIRIIFSWFRGMVSGKAVEILGKITDPYLDWWRSKLNLRVGFIDFSAIAGITFLYFLQSIFNMLYIAERITIGHVLAIVVISFWSVVSFILGFCIIIIILRLIAYLTNRNIYSPFWSVIDSISQPLMYRLNRLIFGNKIGNYLHSMIISIILLALFLFGGRFLINLFVNYLFNLPV